MPPIIRTRSLRRPTGSSLLEVVVALAMVAVALGPIGQLIASTREGARLARERTLCGFAAAQKMEQLASGRWGFDAIGVPVADTATDFSSDGAAAPGGAGLSVSPPDSLLADRPGHVDYLDEWGRWTGAGAGAGPPGRAVFTRRWNVARLNADPAHTLVLQVVVFARSRGAAAPGLPRAPSPEGAWLVALRTRSSP